MLGTEIDANGLYQGWSNLFNYNSSELLEISKTLPYPQGTKYKLSTTSGIDFDSWIETYLTLQKSDETTLLKFYVLMIKNLSSNSKEVELKYSPLYKEAADILVQILDSHHKTEYSLDKSEKTLKNFVAARLQQIIQGPKNLIGAYSPITMDDLHEAADAAPNQVEAWTVENPAYIGIMQTQNMVGKKGVGIAANGQKAAFIWKYWMTDELKNHGKYYEFVKFPSDLIISRVEGAAEKNPQPKAIKGLPDINKDGVSEEDLDIFAFTSNHYITSDLASSQMISAATDNAKELILDRINANTDLSKVYMFLITLGFDVKDIVAFMTNPVIDLVAKTALSNIFLNLKIKALDVAGYIINKINEQLPVEVDDEGNSIEQKSYSTSSINSTYAQLIDSKIESLEKEKLTNFKLDLEEFIKIYKLASEFSNAGRLLGINLGVATTKEGLLKFKTFVTRIIRDREEDIENPIKFDFYKWLNDANYRLEIIEYYDKIKGSLNVFALVEAVPHFKSILEIYNLIALIDHNLSAKGQLLDYFFDLISDEFKYVDYRYGAKLLPVIEKYFIKEFIKSSDIIIPIKEGYSKINPEYQLEPVLYDGFLSFKNNSELESTLASFNYVMVNYIIPELKQQYKTNEFINGLTPFIDNNSIKYKLALDMQAIDKNAGAKVQYLRYLKGLSELSSIEFGNISLTDIFMLYNLVVNLNLEGSDRMTSLFTEFVNQGILKDNLINRYLKFIGEIDYSIKNKSGNLIKKIVELIKEEVPLNDILVLTAVTARSEANRNDPSIRIIDEKTGLVIYKRKNLYGKYDDLPDTLPEVMDELEIEKVERSILRELYGFLPTFSGYIKNTILNLSNFNNLTAWISTLNRLLKNGLVKLNPKCD